MLITQAPSLEIFELFNVNPFHWYGSDPKSFISLQKYFALINSYNALSVIQIICLAASSFRRNWILPPPTCIDSYYDSEKQKIQLSSGN